MIEKLKKYLNLTWEDDDIDNRLKELLEQSKTSLNSLIGVELDYEDKELEELLFNRVRYAYSNSIEYFAEDCHSQILRMQLIKGVESLEK